MITGSYDADYTKGQLNVLPNTAKTGSPKTQPLSDRNREFLEERLNTIANTIMKGGEEEQGYFSEFIRRYSNKGATQIGTQAGNLIGATYGTGIVNASIDKVVLAILGSSINPRMIDMTANGFKILLTSKIAPGLTALSGAAGGIALPAAIAIVIKIYSGLLASKKCTLATLPPVDQLIRFDSTGRKFFDALGQELDDQDLKNLQLLVTEFDLISKILASADRNEIGEILYQAFNFDSEEFKNLGSHLERMLGSKISTMQAELQGNNRYGNKDTLIETLKEFVQHTMRPINYLNAENSQRLHTMDKDVQSIVDTVALPESRDGCYYFDESTKRFYLPYSWATSVWYYQAPDALAKQVSNVIKPDLLDSCNKIKTNVSGLVTISSEEKKEALNNLDKIMKSVSDLHLQFIKLNSNELNLAAIELLEEVKKQVDEIKSTLESK